MHGRRAHRRLAMASWTARQSVEAASRKQVAFIQRRRLGAFASAYNLPRRGFKYVILSFACSCSVEREGTHECILCNHDMHVMCPNRVIKFSALSSQGLAKTMAMGEQSRTWAHFDLQMPHIYEDAVLRWGVPERLVQEALSSELRLPWSVLCAERPHVAAPECLPDRAWPCTFMLVYVYTNVCIPVRVCGVSANRGLPSAAPRPCTHTCLPPSFILASCTYFSGAKSQIYMSRR
jgi:hypothetical protein